MRGHGQHKLQSETLSQTKHKKKLKILYFFLHITILDTIKVKYICFHDFLELYHFVSEGEN